MRKVVAWGVVVGILGGGTCGVARQESPRVPDDAAVSCYMELYKSSVIRGIGFSQEPDPREAVREEIYIEKKLAKEAAAAGVTTDPLLQADIRYYQSQEILNEWLSFHVPEDAVTTGEIVEYYERHKPQFTTTETVKFCHIFFLVPQGDAQAEKEKLALAKKVKEKLAKGTDFQTLAAEYSELPSAKQNKGVVGPEKLSKLNSAIQAALQKLAPGQVSEPVRTPYGWEILQLLEKNPPRVQSLDEVRDIIRSELRHQKARELQATATRELAKRYPAQVNKELLESSGPLPRSEWVYSIKGTTATVETVLADIYATWSYNDISDERERIKAALPRLILTRQVVLAAEEDGILSNPCVQLKLRFIENRLSGERFWQRLAPAQKPNEKELRAFYEKMKNVFVTPPQAKGEVFRWSLAKAAATTEGLSTHYLRQVLEEKVHQLREQAVSGKLTRDDLRKLADSAQELDWFREGPNGYYFDKAFFGAKEQSYTDVFPTRDGVAFGWVEARRASQPRPFEECRDLVERRYMNDKGEEMRKKLLEKILSDYARLRR